MANPTPPAPAPPPDQMLGHLDATADEECGCTVPDPDNQFTGCGPAYPSHVYPRPWLPSDLGEEGRAWPRPTPVLVWDPDHSRSTGAYLQDLDLHRGWYPGSRRLVLRPTPGARDRTTLALDLLSTLGKNPVLLAADRLGRQAWPTAVSWAAAARLQDLFVDRADTLPVERLAELARLTTALDASLWLIWGSNRIDSRAAQDVIEQITGLEMPCIAPSDMTAVLPLPSSASFPPRLIPDTDGWPTVLPAADFPTFRAACRRHLGPHAFARVDALYRDAAAATVAWLAAHDPRTTVDSYLQPTIPLTGIHRPLTGWLRDEHLGTADTAVRALTVLRATQAALFVQAIWLRWDCSALGPRPVERLPGTLAPRIAGGLYAMPRTQQVAATALSLHLNQPCTYFGCWRLRDVTPDGAALTPSAVHRRHPAGSPAPGTEIACLDTVRIPTYARVLISAHVMHRRSHDGATGDDPLFAARTGHEFTTATLRGHIARACGRLNLAPPWIHSGDCKYGADIGLNPRPHGWLPERGLSLHQLDPRAAAAHPPASRPATS